MGADDVREMVNKLHAARLGQEEIDEVMKVLREGKLSALSSERVSEFEKKFAEYNHSKYAIAVTSGTAALHCALAACGIGCGDEVIIPAFSFPALPFAILYQNGLPIFVDIDMESYCIDVDKIEAEITEKTKAIIAVHLFGHPADMKRIGEIAEKHDLFVIEDCAHAHGAEIHGRKAGTFGSIGCFSFQEYKIMTTAEGGMAITDDEELALRLKEVAHMSKFDYDRLSYSYRMDAVRAAIGIAQLKRLDSLIKRRNEVAERYSDQLEGFLVVPTIKKGYKSCFSYYACRAFGEHTRNRIFDELLKAGVPVIVFHDRSLNQMSIFRRSDNVCLFKCPHLSLEHLIRNRDARFQNSEKFAKEHLLFPISAGLDDEIVDIIIQKTKKVVNNIKLESTVPLCTCPI